MSDQRAVDAHGATAPVHLGTVGQVVDPRAVDVARRAVEIGRAAGVDLADDLSLWALAGGRPQRTPAPGRPDELGLLLEAATHAPQRRARGLHYTPEGLASGLVERALAGHRQPSVCDPSCGGGALLLAAARHQAQAGGDPAEILGRLWGADIDPLAVATTEVALNLWARRRPPPGNLVIADMLQAPPTWAPFDVVVGNPPFLSQLDAATTRSSADGERWRARFGGAVQAYTNPAALFLLAGCLLTRSGGTVAMVQPQSVMGARDAAGVREAVDGQAWLREVWVPNGRAFAAAVEVCVPVLDVGAGHGEAPSWGEHLARSFGVPRVALGPGATLADEAVTAAAFRAEYYGIAPHVREEEDLPGGRPLLTTGLVDLGRSAWGERPARVAGRRWERPVVDVAALEGRASVWANRSAAPKLIIASQTRVVEVVVDADGRFVPGVPLVVAWAPASRLWALAAALASPPVTAWAAARAAGTALAPGALKLTAALVREAPLPIDHDAWRAGADALERRDLLRFADAMTAAYRCDPAVAVWWLDRVGSAWSEHAPTR